MPDQVHVVTAFLRHAGEILLLRRSADVGSYRGCWAAVSGYLEGPDALAQVLREVEEETGIDRGQLQLVAAGAPLTVTDAMLAREWVVHPFLFELAVRPRVQLDWEHSAWCWVRPPFPGELQTVPSLELALRACGPAASTGAREDREE